MKNAHKWLKWAASHDWGDTSFINAQGAIELYDEFEDTWISFTDSAELMAWAGY